MKTYHLSILENIKLLCGLLSQEQYKQPLEVLSGSSVGQHARHIIEFYQCLHGGIVSGSVNYDKRERNQLIESIPDYAINCVEQLQENLGSFDLHAGLMVVHEIEGEYMQYPSSLSRELYYLAEHTVHHFALIKIGILDAFSNIQLPEHFGVADSTKKHRETCIIH
jgi:hypothetical protein